MGLRVIGGDGNGILHLLSCVRKRDYGLRMEMKKENPVRGSVCRGMAGREKSKRRSSLEEIQSY